MARRLPGDDAGARATADELKGIDLNQVLESLDAALHRANELIKTDNGAIKPNALSLNFYRCGTAGCLGCPHTRWRMWKTHKPRGRALRPGEPPLCQVDVAHPLKSPHVARRPSLRQLVEVCETLRLHRGRVVAQIKRRKAVHLEALRFGRTALAYLSTVTENPA